MSSSIRRFHPLTAFPPSGEGFSSAPPPLGGHQQKQFLSALKKLATTGQANATDPSEKAKWASLADQVSQMKSGSVPDPKQMQKLFESMKSLNISPQQIQAAGGPTPPKDLPTGFSTQDRFESSDT